MRRSNFLLLIILFPLFSIGQNWKTFIDTAGKFTAQYPSNWVNKIKEGNRVFFTSPSDGDSDNFYENINISVSQKPGYGTGLRIRDLFPTVTEGLKKQFVKFKDEGLRYFMWNNIEAAEIIYSGTNKIDETLKIRTTQWYCFYKSRLYIATFVASENNHNHDATALKIMNSILFK